LESRENGRGKGDSGLGEVCAEDSGKLRGRGKRGATGRSASVGICSAEAQRSEAAAANRARSLSEYSGDEVEVEVEGWGEQMRWKVERMKRREE
jgi:hypothetical protein